MSSLRIVVADDHPVFRHGIRALLEMTPDVVVAGEATTGDEVVAMAERLQPDLILMDVQMPGLNGIEATRRIIQASPYIRVLVVTMFEDDASVFTAMRAGARGYILKDATQDELLRAIRAAANGEAIFSSSIASRLLNFFMARHPTIPKAVFPELTEREQEILDLLAQGKNNSEIAAWLSLSAKTVSNYVSNILNKLQVTDRTEAIIRARDAGLGRG
jgi:DNA-binding NarL/FixJ family response regulator